MSETATKTAKELKAILRQLNQLVGRLGTVRRQKLHKKTMLNNRVQKLREQYGADIDELGKEEDQLIDEILDLIKVRSRFLRLVVKGTKTIKLRNGPISLRKGKEAIEITDPKGEEAVIERIARLGGLRKYTRVGPRTLNRDALKANPAFVARVKGLEIVRNSKLIIKPAKVQGEISREVDELVSITWPEEGD